MDWQNILKKKPLVGKQKKLDKNNDGKISSDDFEIMRKFSLFGEKPPKSSEVGKVDTEEEEEDE